MALMTFTPFTNCIKETDNAQIDNPKDLGTMTST